MWQVCVRVLYKWWAWTVFDLQEEGSLKFNAIKSDSSLGSTGAVLYSPFLAMNCD
jgi:hypothetical protein